MNRLYISPIADVTEIPDFGDEFQSHIANKKNPEVLRASLSAWNLLARAMGGGQLPKVVFGEAGRPSFETGGVCFSISHSCALCAVLISDLPCGVDIERIRPDVAEKLRTRCLLPSESGLDFFEAWTLKECAGKLTGEGIRPLKTDTTLIPMERRFSAEFEFDGERYRVSCVSSANGTFELCDGADQLINVNYNKF